MSQTVRTAIRIAILIAMACGILYAQATSSEIQRYKTEIQTCMAVTGTWQRDANLEKGFVIAVLVFGALITIFQGLSKGWCKPATLALGALTTILTGVNAELFPADYRVLEQSVVDGNDLIDQLNNIADVIGQPGADVAGLESQWIAQKTKFSGLQKAVLQHGSQSTQSAQEKALLFWQGTVYASPVAPPWISRPPGDDSNNLYFTGTAEDRSIELARKRSLDAAVAAAASRFAAGDPTRVEALSKVITSAAVIDKSSFEFDREKKTYRYYTLVRISKDIANLAPRHLKTVAVPGETTWMDTEVRVSQGDTISFQASGKVSWAIGETVGPEGSATKLRPVAGRPKYPVAEIGAGGLIGRIGNGAPFAVGGGKTVVASETGAVFLGVNDNTYKDNSGSFSVSVSWNSR